MNKSDCCNAEIQLDLASSYEYTEEQKINCGNEKADILGRCCHTCSKCGKAIN